MIDRTKEINDLCDKILNTESPIITNNNGADYYICPFCYEELTTYFSDIEHSKDCAITLAKELKHAIGVDNLFQSWNKEEK